jgi:hypothetical protein
MLKRYLAAVALAVGLAPAQVSEQAFDEAAFRRAVQDGLPLDRRERAMFFALRHEEIAAPILLAQVKSKMNDPGAEFLVRTMADWAVYNADKRAIDTVAELCLADQSRFSWMVGQLMNRALSRERAYELARYAAEQYPNLRGPVVQWVGDALKIQPTDARLAREMLKSEKAGKPIDENDPLLSRLPAPARDQISRAIQEQRTAADRRGN